MGLLETRDERPELRQAEPVRHLAAEHATLELATAHGALPGDHEDEGKAVAMGALQEAEQRVMGVELGHAVQIEPGIYVALAAREPRAIAAADRRQRRGRRLDLFGTASRD